MSLTTRLVAVAAILMLGFAAPAAVAQTPAPPSDAAASEAGAPPAEVAELRRLLSSPEVQAWLEAEPSWEQAADERTAEAEGALDQVLATIARHREALREGIPAMPSALATAYRALASEAGGYGVPLSAALIVTLIAVGLLAEWRFLRMTRRVRKSVLVSVEDTVPDRLRKLGMRVGLATGAVLAFSAVLVIGFLALDLPPSMRVVVGRALLAAIIFRAILYGLRIALAPGAPERRVAPMPDAHAEFWTRRLTMFAGTFLAGWFLAYSVQLLGAPNPTGLIIGYLFGIALLVLAFGMIWGRRRLFGEHASTAAAVLWSAWALLVFALWLTGTNRLLWLVMIGALLPVAVGVVNRAVNHLLREEPSPTGEEEDATPPSVLAAVIERGARLALILGALSLLMWAWGVGYADILRGEDAVAVAARSVINFGLILVIFDFIWHVARTAINRKLLEVAQSADDPEEARRLARIGTLLPILRNVLGATVLVVAALMALASLGVEIGPLIAGAGVLGVAIGFGAQTVVKDVIAGMLFLLDDAFRVGEYIVAGSYKGTVENFSIRSIKLRHHRGPVYTIPFGELGAIQNMSRDWVIMKLPITVPFETDLNKLKKVIKGVNAELMEDPELAAGMIEPLKSQGADMIGDHGLQVILKFKAIPGTQFPIRRRANALIQKAFKESGIEFAFPTVRVAGEGQEEQVVAAQNAVNAQQKPAAKAEDGPGA